MPPKEQQVPKESTISQQESASTSPTGRTKKKTQERPVSPSKPAPRPVKAKFKAGKDI
jgi:hypothetical protein